MARRELTNVLLAVTNFVREFPMGSARPAPGGGSGTGKTHLAVAALRKIMEKDSNACSGTTKNLLDRIRAGFDPTSASSNREAYRAALDAEVLLLDDLGAHRVLEWVEDTMTSIITYRCDNRKPLIATTNLRETEARSTLGIPSSRATAVRSPKARATKNLPRVRTTPERWQRASALGRDHGSLRCAPSCRCPSSPTTASARGGPPNAGAMPCRCEAPVAGLLFAVAAVPFRRWCRARRQSRQADPLAGRGPAPLYLQAVEFPYYLYPRTLWERELVWLKNIGIRSVEFSIPWNWHQLAPGDFDFSGRTSPRRDLLGLIRILAAVGPQRLGAQCRAGRWMAESGSSGRSRCRRAARLVEAAQRHFGDADRQPRRSGGLGGRRRTRDRRRRPARRRAHLRRRSGRAGTQPPGLATGKSVLWTAWKIGFTQPVGKATAERCWSRARRVERR